MASVKNQPVEPPTDAPPIRFSCGACAKNPRVAARLAGKKVKCPNAALVPLPEPAPVEAAAVDEVPLAEVLPEPARLRVLPIVAVFSVLAVVIGCSAYANLAFAVSNRANFKYFPPFKAHHNENHNDQFGAEYLSIAKAMVAGKGFSSPFRDETGPTAWMPPILPCILAVLLWACDGNVNAVMTVCLFLHGSVLILTGFLVLALAWQTTGRLGVLVAAAFFSVGVIGDFRMWFQTTHDTSLVLLALDLVIAGFVWGRPLQGWKSAACWGLAGGICAMTSPIVGLTWGGLSIALMIRERAWFPLGIAMLLAAVTLAPWTIRNYLVFGKLLPVKSNTAYELWQSQHGTVRVLSFDTDPTVMSALLTPDGNEGVSPP